MKWFEAEYYNGHDFDYKFLFSKAYINIESIAYITADVLGVDPHIIIGVGNKELMLTDKSADRLLLQIGLTREDILYQGAYAFR